MRRPQRRAAYFGMGDGSESSLPDLIGFLLRTALRLMAMRVLAIFEVPFVTRFEVDVAFRLPCAVVLRSGRTYVDPRHKATTL